MVTTEARLSDTESENPETQNGDYFVMTSLSSSSFPKFIISSLIWWIRLHYGLQSYIFFGFSVFNNRFSSFHWRFPLSSLRQPCNSITGVQQTKEGKDMHLISPQHLPVSLFPIPTTQSTRGEVQIPAPGFI
jgi:hypothetical protein